MGIFAFKLNQKVIGELSYIAFISFVFVVAVAACSALFIKRQPIQKPKNKVNSVGSSADSVTSPPGSIGTTPPSTVTCTKLGGDECGHDEVCTTKLPYSNDLTEEQLKVLMCKKKLEIGEKCKGTGEPSKIEGACYYNKSDWNPFLSSLCTDITKDDNKKEFQCTRSTSLWWISLPVGLIFVFGCVMFVMLGMLGTRPRRRD